MNLHTLTDAADFIEALSPEDNSKISAHIKALAHSQTDRLIIKTLSGKIKELIIKQYRIVFFVINDTCFIADAFQKKSQKTPKRYIERAEKIYKLIINKST